MSNQRQHLQQQQPPPQQPQPQQPHWLGHPQTHPHQQQQQQHPYPYVPPALTPSWSARESSAKFQAQQQRHQQPDPMTFNSMAASGSALPLNNAVPQYSQPQARKRIAQSACETCRRKRTRCVADSSGDCLNCIALGVECVFSGVDRRKESIKDLRARAAYLEQLVDRIRSAASGSELDRVIQDVKNDTGSGAGGAGGAGDLQLGRNRASSTQSSSSTLTTSAREPLTSPSLSKKRFRPAADTGTGDELEYKKPMDGALGSSSTSNRAVRTTATDETNTYDDMSSSSSSNQGPSMSFDLRGDLVKTEHDSLTAHLTELVDRLTIANDGTIRAIGATSNELFNESIGSSPSPTMPASHFPMSPASYPNVKPTKTTSSGPQSVTDLTAGDVSGLILQSGTRLPPCTTSEVVEHLLNLFFIWHQCAFPIISRRAFLESAKYGGEYFCPLLLNAILAFASQWSDWPSIRTDPNDPYTAGDAFFQIAKDLLDEDLDKPTIVTVQALCIMASRESGCGRDVRGWLYNGICCRLALDLGLHLDATSLLARGILTEKDLCIRVITFWEAWYFDKEYSALIGRPSSMKDVVTTCPTADELRKNSKMNAIIHEDIMDWSEATRTGVAVSINRDRRSELSSRPPPLGVSTTCLASMFVRVGGTYDKAASRLYYTGRLGVGAGLDKLASPKEQLLEIDRTIADFAKAVAFMPSIEEQDDTADGYESDRHQPFLLQLHMVYQCCILLLDRPFISRQCPKWQDCGHDSLRCPLIHRATDDENSPRERCFASALRIVKLYELWRANIPPGVLPMNNSLQHCLFCVATVFIVESEGIVTSESSQRSIDRKRMARELLHGKILGWYEEIAKRRLAGKRLLDSMRSLLAVKKKEEETRSLSDQARWGAPAVSLHESRIQSPNRPPLVDEDSGVSVSDKHVVPYGREAGRSTYGPEHTQKPPFAMVPESIATPIYSNEPAFGSAALLQFSTPRQWIEASGSNYPAYLRSEFVAPPITFQQLAPASVQLGANQHSGHPEQEQQPYEPYQRNIHQQMVDQNTYGRHAQTFNFQPGYQVQAPYGQQRTATSYSMTPSASEHRARSGTVASQPSSLHELQSSPGQRAQRAQQQQSQLQQYQQHSSYQQQQPQQQSQYMQPQYPQSQHQQAAEYAQQQVFGSEPESPQGPGEAGHPRSAQGPTSMYTHNVPYPYTQS